MLDSPLLPLDLMPSTHTKCRIAGVKRGVGRAAYDFCSAFLMAKLAGASSFTLLESADTWPLFRRSPVKAKLLTEATFDCVLDARADRCGLLADRLGAGLVERVLPGEAQLERRRAYRPQKGCWEWWCQTHAPCPCTGCFQARDVIVAGLWRPLPSRVPQSRWHTLTTCCVGDSTQHRLRAMGWLAHRLSDFGTQQAHYALTALSGGADRLGTREQHAALRFMLGLPDAPRSQLITESPEAAQTLALGYGRGFLKWIVAILGEGRKAACTARLGSSKTVNAVRTIAASYRGQTIIVQRPAPRSAWTASRGLRETWDGACLVRRAFRAIRLWTIMAGPDALHRPPRTLGTPTSVPDRTGGREAGHRAYDQWADYIDFLRALADKLHPLEAKLLAIAGSHQRKLVWLRNAGFDPTIERRKQARVEAARQAAAQARQHKQEAKEARVAAQAQRCELARIARAAADVATETARLASAAVTRPVRATNEATIAAIDANRRCNQACPFEPPLEAAPASVTPRLRCTRGHFLVPAPVRGGRGGFQPRCNGPCGTQIRPGTTRWMCEGRACDLDICLECVATKASEGPSRARVRCPRGHSMRFRITSTLAHPDRVCDGECRRPLLEGTLAYECAPCSLDFCAACASDGLQLVEAPPIARAPRKRAREPPPRRVRGRPQSRGGKAPRRAHPSDPRRNLFVDASDDGSASGDESPPVAQGEVHGRGNKRRRDPDDPPAGEPWRQPHGEGPGRKRSGPTSIHSRGQGL